MRFLQGFAIAAAALLAAAPARADTPVSPAQVEINATLIEAPLKIVQTVGSLSGLVFQTRTQVHASVLDADKGGKLLSAMMLARDLGNAKILAEPKAVTRSGNASEFNSNLARVAVPTYEDGKLSVEFRELGTDFSVRPVVKSDGRISLEARFRIRTAKPGRAILGGRLPGFDEQGALASIELDSGQVFAVAITPDTGDGDAKAQLALITARTLPPVGPSVTAQAPATRSGPGSADRLSTIARQLADEYQQAANSGDKELAAKLARMALDLDPLCFKKK